MDTEHLSKSRSGRYLRRKSCVLISLTIGLVLVGTVLLWARAQASGVEVSLEGSAAEPALAAYGEYGVSYVFRFSPTLQAFEVFTIPTAGAAPDGVVVSDSGIWFAETGADRIGRLVYTGTTDYAFQEYELPAGSRPMNVAVDGDGRVWFTEHGRNRIGYVDASTGITYEFVISTTDVAPMDLDVAPNDSIWFTERATDHIGQLIFTTTTDYQVREFYVGMPDAGLSGVLAQGNDRIWAALSNKGRLVLLKPSVPNVYPTSALTSTAYPFMLAPASGDQSLWFTELYGNHISLFVVSTNEWGLRYTVPSANSRPYNLDVDSTGAVWFSEQAGGKIGRLALTPMGTFTEFPVPLQHGRIQGLDVDAEDVVWFVADSWSILNLPIVMR